MTAGVRPQPPITYTRIPAAPAPAVAPVEKPEFEIFVEPLEYTPAAELQPQPVGGDSADGESSAAHGGRRIDLAAARTRGWRSSSSVQLT